MSPDRFFKFCVLSNWTTIHNKYFLAYVDVHLMQIMFDLNFNACTFQLDVQEHKYLIQMKLNF